MKQAERRMGVRRPARTATKAGTLEIKGRARPVLVLDQSVAGVGVLAVRLRHVTVGTHVKLHTGVQHLECRVASVDEMSLSGTSVTRLGLETME